MAENVNSIFPQVEIMKYCPKNARKCERQEEIQNDFDPLQVFLDIPYLSEYRKYEDTIRKTLEQYGLKPILAETEADYEDLLCNVCKKIQKSGYAVADISNHKPNVMYELGLIQSLGKKCCILRNSVTKLPPDLGGLIIPPYKNEGDIEKILSKWIKGNMGYIGSKILKQRRIFDDIFLRLATKDIDEIGKSIDEIKMIGEINPFTNEYNRVLDSLIDFLKDEVSNVRWSAAHSFVWIRDPRAVEPLIEALGDDFYIVRGRAADALVAIGDAAVEPLITSLRDDNPNVRREATYALGQIGDARAIKPLANLLKDKNEWVRKTAKEAIEKIRSTQKEKEK